MNFNSIPKIIKVILLGITFIILLVSISMTLYYLRAEVLKGGS